jgi:hypothetical protein
LLIIFIEHDSIFTVAVLHVYGEPYSMGFAHGQLLMGEVNTTIPAFYQYVQKEVDTKIDFIPKDIRDMVSKYGLDGALDLTYELTKKYIPSYFIEEIQGLAKGSGVDYQLLLRAHMLPELIKVYRFYLPQNY